jgi:transposase-like protein
VQIERLVMRDRLPPQEAVRVLAHDRRWDVTSDAARTLMAALPLRARPIEVPLEPSAVLMAGTASPQDRLIEDDLEKRAAFVRLALQQALRALTPDERRLLSIRFRRGAAVSEIARQSGVDQKTLYRRYDRILRGLRDALESAHVTLDDIRPLLGRGMVDSALASSWNEKHDEARGEPADRALQSASTAFLHSA